MKAESWEEPHGRSEEENVETVVHCDRCCCQHHYTEAEEGPGSQDRGGRGDQGVSLRDSLVHLGVHLEVPKVWPWNLPYLGVRLASWDQDSCWPSGYLVEVASASVDL